MGDFHVDETEYINALAELGFDIRVTTVWSQWMQDNRIYLCDVFTILRYGFVIRCSMSGMTGIWGVYGYTDDGVRLDLTISVRHYEVELLYIEKGEWRPK